MRRRSARRIGSVSMRPRPTCNRTSQVVTRDNGDKWVDGVNTTCRPVRRLPVAVVMFPFRATAVLCLMALCVVSLEGQSRVNELNDAGWKALRDGYQDRAANLFAEALELRPNDPVLLMGAGAAAHAQGKQKEIGRA